MEDQKQTPAIGLHDAPDLRALEGVLGFLDQRRETKSIHGRNYIQGGPSCKARHMSDQTLASHLNKAQQSLLGPLPVGSPSVGKKYLTGQQ